MSDSIDRFRYTFGSLSDCVSTHSLLLALLSLFSATTMTMYVIGNVCTDCVACARADDGDVAVVTAVSHKGPNNTATVYVFPDKADALLASKHFMAVDSARPGGSPADAGDLLGADALASLLGRCRRKIENAKKGSFNVSFSPNWRELFAPPGAVPEVIDDLVGEVVAVKDMVQYDSSGVAAAEPLYSGDATVVKLHDVVPDTYVLSVDYRADLLSTDLFVWVAKATLKDLVEAAKTSDVSLPSRLVGLHAYKLAKSLPAATVATGLDAREFIELALHAGLDVDGVTHDMPGVVAVFGGLVRELQAVLDRRSGAESRTWPDLSAKRLGLAIKRFAAEPVVPGSTTRGGDGGSRGGDGGLPAPPAPPQFPLYQSLSVALTIQLPEAVPAASALAEVRSYVAAACTVAATKQLIIDNDYCAMGAMEGFLKSGSQSAESIAAADLSSLDKVKWYCVTVQAAASSTPSGTGTTKHSATTMPSINVLPAVASSCEEETRLRSVLRGDAAAVMADGGALGRLLKFQKFADANEPDQLRVAVDSESMAPLHRLCTSGEGIDRALAGA